MAEDVFYIANSVPDRLYVNPYKDKGAYAQLIDERECCIGEIEVNSRFRLSLSMFYSSDKKDFTTFKLVKLKFHKTRGWEKDGELIINGFQLNKLQEFVSLIGSLNLSDVTKTRISLDSLNNDALNAVLGTDKGVEFLKKVAESPELTEDIFALAHKKTELLVFEKLLNEYDSFKDEYISSHQLKKKGEEDIWQHFFERNEWIFGHGLNYVFLHKVSKKLESTVAGHTFNSSGKRVDALMRTKAIMSQYVLAEIKKPSTPLLANDSDNYRAGCWRISGELSGAVSQIQKTVFDFVKNQPSKDQLKDGSGNNTGDEVYKVNPKSYLIVGKLSQLAENDDKFTCFQLFRGALQSPEIITFDELFERAKCIVETISHKE